MATNDLNNNENILIKVDQNNLIYIDPNSVVNNGIVEPRGTNAENFVTYLNLEADLVPRSVLNSSNDGGGTLTSVASGVLNLLQNKNSDYLDTSWTDVYTNQPSNALNKEGKPIKDTYVPNQDSSGQSFGITSVAVEVRGTNFIPSVTINFVDVRGKVLFESHKSSPYNAFFHQPWPIFYLTIKGYYGKAIKYRLHLVSFNSTFNASNGNFEITTKFVGSTYAFLNHIPLTAVLNAPYMFGIEKPEKREVNESTGEVKVKLSKSSRGYQTLKSVYQEYRRKGLIDIPDDVNPTLRELITKAKSLDVELERMIFSEVADMSIFAQVKAIEDVLTEYRGAVQAWKTRYLTAEYTTIPENNGEQYFHMTKGDGSTDKFLIGDTGSSLQSIIKAYDEKLTKALKTASDKVNNSGQDRKTKNDLRISITNPIKKVEPYYTKSSGKYVVAINKLLTQILDVNKAFLEQKLKLQDAVEKKMNEFYVDKSKGIGFEPTIRNVFGIILANADTYIKLMKSTHLQAHNVGKERADILVGFESETPNKNAIYPWPEVKKVSEGNSKVLAYPGEKDLIGKLNSDNKVLWPEVDFVENYYAVSTLKVDNLVNKEKTFNSTVFVFDSNDVDQKSLKPISTTKVIHGTIPYMDKNLASIMYEIYERTQVVSLYDTFTEGTLGELGKLEFDTLQELVKEDYYIVDILKAQVNSNDTLRDLMRSFSPYERYPYYQDKLPTTSYLKDLRGTSFKLESYKGGSTVNPDRNEEYPKLQEELLNYTNEEYRTKIYPYTSDTYLGYIAKESFTKDEIDIRGLFKINTNEGFISSPVEPKAWGNLLNLFERNIGVGDEDVHILNSPYFHKQIFEDFHNTNAEGKYKGSSYLLLNSMDFKDLTHYIKLDGKEVRMSSLFTEVGASHYIPYHLILKWGSIYHRYKTFLIDGVDIIDGADQNINVQTFFDNSNNVSYSGITYASNEHVGLYPYYSSIYHQVLNDYTFFDPNDTTGGTFESAITNKYLYVNGFKPSGGNDRTYYNSFVDNSRWDSNDQRYTILPSHDRMLRFNYLSDFTDTSLFNFKTNWSRNSKNFKINEYTLTGQTIPQYGEHFVDMGTNNKKVIDLIGTFSPDILDSFETAFLNFASEKVETYSEYKQFEGVTYDKFQDLLRALSSVKKETSDDLTNIDTVIKNISNRQNLSHEQITEEIYGTNNLLKLTISNPKELDSHILSAYARELDRLVDFGSFNPNQVVGNSKYIELFIGEDIDGYYGEFFQISDIELSEDNAYDFRSIIKIYGGYRKNGGTADRDSFQQYLLTNIITPHRARHDFLLREITSSLSGLKRDQDENNNQSIIGNYGDTPLKLQLYNTFKQFNDQWVAGNSLGQKLLMEEFLFLDKANKDIGNDFFIDLKKLIGLEAPENQGLELYGAISMVLARTNVDIRALPAYVNFYANNNNKTRVKPSKDIANVMFGKYLEVDLEYSTPKIILQYVGRTSKHLDLNSINKEYFYLDDGFNIEDPQSNPLLVTNPKYFESSELSKSNKVVAFEVAFGDQNQGLFKSVSLDQSQFRNTFESNLAIERLGRSESGSGTGQIDISLYDIYETRSYSCEVEAMGNVMIQPTMYFQLKNVPLFKGAYWITEVSHRVEGNSVSTRFKGVRIPKDSLPDPKESFTASYRVLFDKILNSAVAKISSASSVSTEETITTSEGTFTTDRGGIKIEGEELVNEVGYTRVGVPFNGYNNFKSIQKVKYKGNVWLRSRVFTMGEGMTDTMSMFLPTKVKNHTVKPSKLEWSEIKNSNKYFYSCLFLVDKWGTNTVDELMFSSNTQFLNPLNNKSKTVTADSQLNSDNGTRYVNGPVDSGERSINKDGQTSVYGLTLSKLLMKDLGLKDGDVVYFKIE
jgi:hypothetical protein